MSIMGRTSFSWIPFYTELAEKLLEYKDKREELVEFILSEDGLREFSDYLHLEDKKQKIDDIDPFSFMGMFNRGSFSPNNRIKILTKIKQRFDIVANVPSDFDGIPVLNYSRMFFYNWHNLKDSCDTIWSAFEQMMNGDISQWFDYYKFQTRKAECTMPLFWCKADEYIALDSRNRDYLESIGVDANVNDVDSYKALLQDLKDKMESGQLKEKSFAEISYNAWIAPKPTRYWLYAPGEKAQHWNSFYSCGIVAIGWEELGDLSKYSKKSELKSAMDDEYGTDSSHKNSVACTWDFVHNMNIGDVVFVKQGKSKILGYGIVASDYYYDENREFYNSLRDVDWKVKGEWEHPGDAVLKTLTDITTYPDYVEKLKSLFTMNSEIQQYTKLLEFKKNIILQGAPGTGKTYNTAALALSICGESVPESHDEVMQRYDELQKEGRIGFCTFHQSMDYEDFVEGIKPVTEGTSIKYEVKDGIFKKIADRARLNFEDSQKTPEQVKSDTRTREVFEGFCEETQSQLNENDFVDLYSKSKMKIRNITFRSDGSPLSIQLSKTDGGPTQSLTWEIILRDYNNFKEGKIKSYEDVKPRYESKSVYHGNAMYYFELYKKMKDFEDKYAGNTNSSVVNLQNYVLIIDEINRGNVSRIFGELITLLEKDKRLGGEHPIKVTLPYSKESFGVPENLYIIGTMNTTDRSVGNIDYAVRRRFAFATLQSKRDLVVANSTEKAAVLFDAVKSFIEKNKTEMDFEDLMVGHSYFFAKDDDELALRWQYEILPLLNEYIKDDILRADRLESNMSVDAFI